MNNPLEAPLLSGVQTIQSIRDTGYKGTDYAIAELIDNAIDANARHVIVAIVEQMVAGTVRATTRVQEIAVIDDGCGMDEKTANLALSFGGSGHFDSRKTIGRFGMGLPQASVSQCRRTTLWSWQESQPEGAHFTYLDLDEIEKNGSTNLVVPWPKRPGDSGYVRLPDWIVDLYREQATSTMVAGQPLYSGTVVRWEQLDRLRWVKACTILSHVEYLIGRIYRRFLQKDHEPAPIQISIVILERHNDSSLDIKKHKKEHKNVLPNDPMYLMTPKECNLGYWEREGSETAASSSGKSDLEKVTDEPPFVISQPPRHYKIPVGNSESEVVVRFSEAKPEARPGRNAGADTHLGKHSKNNRGISMMRLGRELILDETMVTEPVDRWWGVEVEFSPALDEIFGVTNNKQDTPYFATALRYVLDNDRLSPEEALKEGLFEENGPIAHLYRIAYDIVKAIGSIKTESKRKQSARRKAKDQPNTTPIISSIKEKEAEETPTPGEKEAKKVAPGEIEEKLKNEIAETTGSQEVAEIITEQYRKGLKVHFLEGKQDQSPVFFWPGEVYDDQQIFLNTGHPAYEHLIEPLRLSDKQIEELTEADAKKMLGRASDALALLLFAYARLELEVASDEKLAQNYQRVREEWGRRLKAIVTDETFAEFFNELDG